MKYNVEDVKKMLITVSDDKLNYAIAKGALKLNQNQIETIVFLFFLCYLSERDIETPLKKVWDKMPGVPSEIILRAKELMNEYLSDKETKGLLLEDILKKEVSSEIATKIRQAVKESYNEKPILNIDNLSTFGEKIKAYEKMFAKNNVTAILWKIKLIRDDMSHGRINELKYEGQSLLLRETKVKILADYMDAVSNPDHSKSQLREKIKIPPEEEERIKKLYDLL